MTRRQQRPEQTRATRHQPSIHRRYSTSTHGCKDADDEKMMDFMMNALKGQVSSNLDMLVHRMDSPFIAPIASFPLPAKFHMPQIEAHDGSKDPLDHLESFKTLMHFEGVLDKIICRAFPTTLKGPTKIWFNRLTPNSINTFKELSTQFASHFIGGTSTRSPLHA